MNMVQRARARDAETRKFAAHVTSLAFNLSLSRNMIITLAQIAGHAEKYERDVFVAFGGFDTAVTSGRALEERGLVYGFNPERPGMYRLTKAGEHVLELLKIAGLIEQVKIVTTA